MTTSVTPVPKSEFRAFIEARSGQNVARCYQCGKCTAGCPVSYAMDLGPRRVMRGIQLGLKDDVLSSKSIWLCVHCQTCSARCPREIEIASVMEACRLAFQLEKGPAGDKDVELFHKLFLDSIGRWGRLSEVDLAGNYNLRSGHLFANMDLVPVMLAKGKLNIMPDRGGAAAVK
jgi:heterodisulfide reductase subunit C